MLPRTFEVEYFAVAINVNHNEEVVSRRAQQHKVNNKLHLAKIGHTKQLVNDHRCECEAEKDDLSRYDSQEH